MTALDRYARLEAIGHYHDARISGERAAPREVVVSFGAHSLIIMGLDDQPIAHWPLASLRATGAPAASRLEVAPDQVGDERLVLEDREMREALNQVCPDLYRTPPPPARQRPWRGIVALAVIAALVAGGFALRAALPNGLADLVPEARAVALGKAVAARLPAVIEPAAPPAICTGAEGAAALRTLVRRVAHGPARPVRFFVLDHPGRDALALPGGRVLLFRGLLQAAHTPEALAGIIAHAIGHAGARDPLHATLDGVGPLTLAEILVGEVAGAEVAAGIADEAASAILAAAHPAKAEADADAVAFGLLSQAGLPTLPYARLAERLAAATPPAGYARRHPWTATRAEAARAADSIGGGAFKPALSDRDWLALDIICEETRPAGIGAW